MAQSYKTIRTERLEIAYLEYGPSDGKPILMLHGWPDNAQTWHEVAEPLADAGWHVLAPALRGFGQTRFLDSKTLRSGQFTAMAEDAIDFVDVLGIEKFTLVGHDWGARAAYQMAANWPERLDRLIALSLPYRSNSSIYRVSPAQQRAFWYQWLFQTIQAQTVLEQTGQELCRELWQTWMAPGHFDEDVFEEVAKDWENPDWIDVTLSSYRYRWRNAGGDPRYDHLESVQLSQPKITVPTIMLQGEMDTVALPKGSEGEESFFNAPYQRIVVPNTGHFIPRESPQAVIDAILSG